MSFTLVHLLFYFEPFFTLNNCSQCLGRTFSQTPAEVCWRFIWNDTIHNSEASDRNLFVNPSNRSLSVRRWTLLPDAHTHTQLLRLQLESLNSRPGAADDWQADVNRAKVQLHHRGDAQEEMVTFERRQTIFEWNNCTLVVSTQLRHIQQLLCCFHNLKLHSYKETFFFPPLDIVKLSRRECFCKKEKLISSI